MTTSDLRRRPVGLTVAAAIGIAILIGLGVWQLRRLQWKEHRLSRIEALRNAPAQLLGPVLARAAAGEDVEWTRVSLDCSPPRRSQALLYSLDQGQVVWRALEHCADSHGYGVVADRGFVQSTRGVMAPTRINLPAPGKIVGILRPPETDSSITAKPTAIPGGHRVGARDYKAATLVASGGGAPGRAIFVVVESETPPGPGLTPAPLPANVPNRHLEYALTWFGLAGALAGVYLAVLWRRLKAR